MSEAVAAEVVSLLSLLQNDLLPFVEDPNSLVEIVLDFGRPVEFRYRSATHYIDDVIVDDAMLAYAVNRLATFGPDNRSGMDGTLHRISRIVDRSGQLAGLTCRVGKAYSGSAQLLHDLIDAGHNILVLGAPGSSKTTKLRDIARYLSTDKLRRVVVVDTSNEIAGDGRTPHAAVGRARRLQVPIKHSQCDVMIEAVENHMPEVIVIDEISTKAEADACRTIAQRGVQLIATAHGSVLSDVVKNPPLLNLIGGVKTVTLGDSEAVKRLDGKKTIQEREMDPIFTCVVEIVSYDEVRVHTEIDTAVDAILNGEEPTPEVRKLVNMRVVKLERPVVHCKGIDYSRPTPADIRQKELDNPVESRGARMDRAQNRRQWHRNQARRHK